jgi:membrane protease YdiL (CAAX protease family)
MFESKEILHRLVGAWWFFALFVVSAIFNTIPGEEFLFRGIFPPKMEGVFRRWSWLAKEVLCGDFVWPIGTLMQKTPPAIRHVY